MFARLTYFAIVEAQLARREMFSMIVYLHAMCYPVRRHLLYAARCPAWRTRVFLLCCPGCGFRLCDAPCLRGHLVYRQCANHCGNPGKGFAHPEATPAVSSYSRGCDFFVGLWLLVGVAGSPKEC